MIFLLRHLLAESAARHPGRVAVRSGSEHLTYAQLEDASGRLAAALIARGVGPGDRVGLFFPKSVPSIVAIFGILKAGAVYVPIDPASPMARVAYIVRNCGIQES